MTSEKQIYCVAPWTVTCLRPDGFFSVCCRAKRDALSISATSLEEYWNGEEMKRLRVAMLNNDPPPDICFNCVNELVHVVPPRTVYNERAERHRQMEEIIVSTSADGTTSFRPTSIDIRTNLCNLKCRTCGPGSSSAIYSEFRAAGMAVPALGPNAQAEEKIVFDDATLAGLNQINWAGGEPFMSKVHWSVMQTLLRLGRIHVPIWYSSNFTFPGGTRARAEELLAHFTQVKIGVSIDGAGKDFEYIRDGAIYSEVMENLLHMKRALPRVGLLIDFTATSLGLFSLPALIEFCLRHGIGMTCKTANLPDGDWLLIGSLRRDVFDTCLDKALQAAAGTRLHDVVFKYVTHIASRYGRCVPDFERCRQRETLRGASGYLESRIGTYLNRAST